LNLGLKPLQLALIGLAGGGIIAIILVLALSGGGADRKSEAERQYRVRAEVQLLSKMNSLIQWTTTSTHRSSILRFGETAAAWAIEMETWEPVPTRFRQAHDDLIAGMTAINEYAETIRSVPRDQASYDAWNTEFTLVITQTDITLDQYKFVVGITLSPLPFF